ncbi:MAG: EF-hand domain-containing protein [Verrucomicrobiaceae bacterium]|nr:MAG: EF-hand domain-containing protein [Verrucomicrobiaceae bacterium]
MTSHHLPAALALFSIVACSPGPGDAVPETRTEKQMLGLMEKFDRWDHNGDGELSAKEIRAGIAGVQGTDKAVTYKAADVVKYYDKDGDKKVSLREAQAGYHATTQEDAPPLPQRATVR